MLYRQFTNGDIEIKANKKKMGKKLQNSLRKSKPIGLCAGRDVV